MKQHDILESNLTSIEQQLTRQKPVSDALALIKQAKALVTARKGLAGVDPTAALVNKTNALALYDQLKSAVDAVNAWSVTVPDKATFEADLDAAIAEDAG